MIKSYDAASPFKRRLWRLVRWLIPHHIRWFYEGNINVPGQLWFKERKLLYNTVRSCRPEFVFEIGTWYGGGSTYFIAQALCDNGFGKLITIELEQEAHRRAKANYARYFAHLEPYVNFYLGDSLEVYPTLLDKIGCVDVLFLDGGNDPQQTAQEFQLFKPYFCQGSVLIAHDWDNEKMRLLRPVIESDSANWIIAQALTAPGSVGMVVCYRQAND